MQPHVAFEHLRGEQCPVSPCVVPGRAQYRAAVAAFIRRFPAVRTYTTWNEANHRSQPVAPHPETVAGFYEELTDACPSCTVVAGDVLDSGSYVRWLQRFRAATATEPLLWGLHNYGDATYLETAGTDAVLAAVPGRLWLEETGGIVTLRDDAGRETLSTNETRAAQGIDQAFSIVATRPRVTRLYVYHWQGRVRDHFDAGLVRPDGSLRPSYWRLATHLAGRSATVATPKVPAPRWRASWSPVKRSQLRLRVTCRATGRRCRGTVTIAVQGRRVATRRYATTVSRTTQTVRVTVPRTARAKLRRASRPRIVLTVSATAPAAAATRVTLRVARPRAA